MYIRRLYLLALLRRKEYDKLFMLTARLSEEIREWSKPQADTLDHLIDQLSFSRCLACMPVAYLRGY